MNTTQTNAQNVWWKARESDAAHYVDHPAAYYLTNALSLVFASVLVWHAHFSKDPFWANLNMIFTTGALTLATSASSLLQIRPLRSSVGLPVIGVLLLAASAWLYQDANNQIVLLLHRYFGFDVSQLGQAVSTGTKDIYAVEVAAGGAILGFIASITVAYSCAFRRTPNGRARTDWWFRCVSLCMTFAFLIVLIVSFRILNSIAADAIAIHAAYDLDFTESYSCSHVPQGSKVLLSKMSDNLGYAMHMELPDRPLLSISGKDADVVALRSNHVTVVTCNEPTAH